MSHTYDYPRPALAADSVIFGLGDGGLKVLLIRRANDPFAGTWALPGGFVTPGESVDDAARRELEEETGLEGPTLEQLHTFGAPDRDPREHVVSVAYFALVDRAACRAVAASDADEAEWFSIGRLPELAFDHGEILALALRRLRAKVRDQPLGWGLLPREFTLIQLQIMYEQVLGKELDKRRFRRKILGTGILVAVPGAKRVAQHYRFDVRGYRRLEKDGFSLEI